MKTLICKLILVNLPILLVFSSRLIANTDSLYLRSLLDKAIKYEYVDSDSNFFYTNKLINDASKSNNSYFLSKAYNQLGGYFKLAGIPDSSVKCFEKAISIAQKINHKGILSDIYGNYGLYFISISDFNNAIKYSKESIKMKISIPDYKYIEYAFVDLGNVYLELSNFQEALQYYNTALKMSFYNKNIKGVAGSYINISGVYNDLGKLNEAEYYANKAAYFFNQIENMYGLTFVKQRMASLNYRKGNYNKAISLSLEAIESAKKVNQVELVANSYELIGNVNMALKNWKEALLNFEKSFDIRKESNNLKHQVNSYINISSVYIKTKDYTKSKHYLAKALSIADSMHNLDALPVIHQNLANADSALGNFQSAFNHLSKYKSYSDSLYNDENKQKLERFKYQHEFELKEQVQKEEAERNRFEMEQSLRISKLERNGVLSFALLIILVALIYFWQQRKLKKQRDQLNSLITKDYELKSLQSQINTHFIYNALNGVSSFIYSNLPDKALSYLNKFAKHLRITLENSRNSWVTLASELESIKCYVELEAIHLDNPPQFQVIVDEGVELESTLIPPMLIQPLVENAFKHALYANSVDSKLLIRVNVTNEKLAITIIDNGPELKTTVSNKKGLSLASKITEERLAVINQQFKTNITFHFSQRETEVGQSSASELQFPLMRA